MGYSTVFYDPKKPDAPLREGQLDIGVADMKLWVEVQQCLRIILSQSLDGVGKSCFDMGTVPLCDWCQRLVDSKKVVRTCGL